jgi:hypothetical protein
MLVRGVLGRLGPASTSTHDIIQLSKLVVRASITQYSRSICTQSNARNALEKSSSVFAHSYSPSVRTITTSRARATTTPKTTRKKSTAKTASSSDGRKKKAGRPKKTAAKKKSAPKRRALTEKGKAKLEAKKAHDALKELKAKALLTEPKRKPDTAYLVIMTENVKPGTSAASEMKAVAEKYKNLSASEKEVRIVVG